MVRECDHGCGGFSNVTYGTSNGSRRWRQRIKRNADVIVGGDNNVTNGDFALVRGIAKHRQCLMELILGGQGNLIEGGTDNCLILGGKNNDIVNYTTHSAILGGESNLIGSTENESRRAVIAGGRFNKILEDGYCGFIGGGYENQILSGGQPLTNSVARPDQFLEAASIKVMAPIHRSWLAGWSCNVPD